MEFGRAVGRVYLKPLLLILPGAARTAHPREVYSTAAQREARGLARSGVRSRASAFARLPERGGRGAERRCSISLPSPSSTTCLQ